MPPQDQHPFIIGDTFYPAFMSALEYKVTKVLCIVEGPILEHETRIKGKQTNTKTITYFSMNLKEWKESATSNT